MKKVTISITFVLLIHFLATSQPCLPDGITFTTQSQIDSFQINYPNCTEIEGFVHIYGESIEDMGGLNTITSIAGDLKISLDTSQTTSLTTLNGLNNLIYVGGDLQILNQPGLTDLSGLGKLTSIQGELILGYNQNIKDLSGLESLTSTGGLDLYVNYSLESLSGLEKVSEVNGMVNILSNIVLTNIEAISNINPVSIEYISIRFNTLLSECSIESICHYLLSPEPSTYLMYNSTGCNTVQEIMDSCGTVGCLPDGITFNNQEDLENFKINYPNCSFIKDDLIISGSDILDISSLNSIISINGNLTIVDNLMLTDLSGLSSLQSINGDLVIGNGSKGGNASLLSTAGLDQLLTINGELVIENNPVLSDITALSSISSSSIMRLHINNNAALSTCSIESICKYLTTSDSVFYISNNLQGCNNKVEVLSTCGEGIEDIDRESGITIYPNPATNQLFFTSKKGLKTESINIYNQLGQLVIKEREVGNEIDISNLGQGLFIVEIITTDWRIIQKLMIKE